MNVASLSTALPLRPDGGVSPLTGASAVFDQMLSIQLGLSTANAASPPPTDVAFLGIATEDCSIAIPSAGSAGAKASAETAQPMTMVLASTPDLSEPAAASRASETSGSTKGPTRSQNGGRKAASLPSNTVAGTTGNQPHAIASNPETQRCEPVSPLVPLMILQAAAIPEIVAAIQTSFEPAGATTGSIDGPERRSPDGARIAEETKQDVGAPIVAAFRTIGRLRAISQTGETTSADAGVPVATLHLPDELAAVLASASSAKALVPDFTASPPAVSGTSGVERHLDTVRNEVWLTDLARDIAGSVAEGGRLKFALAPDTLGRLDVEVHQNLAGISVHMSAHSQAARDLLVAAQPQIVEEIRAQGVRVASTEVSNSGPGPGGDRGGAASQRHFLPVAAAMVAIAPSRLPTPATAEGRFA